MASAPWPPALVIVELDQGKFIASFLQARMWHRIGSIEEVPADRDVRLAVANVDGVHELVFPCRRRGKSWVDAKTRRPIEVNPTH